jgi:protein-glutamine gamma-glutamyltransferase
MIMIGSRSLEPDFGSEYPQGGTEREILRLLTDSDQTYRFPSENRLRFELLLRGEIVTASRLLSRSRLRFSTFRIGLQPRILGTNGKRRFSAETGSKSAEAAGIIYQNSFLYATECATARQIVYYKGCSNCLGMKNSTVFSEPYLMNWYRIALPLQSIGLLQPVNIYLPGDRRYFRNPDVNPETPELRGENVIVLGGGEYYGHGFGIHPPEGFIRFLNQNRM